MSDKVVELSSSCKLELNVYQFGKPEANIVYTEHASDPWYSNTETDCSINKEQAEQMIQLLQEFVRLCDGK